MPARRHTTSRCGPLRPLFRRGDQHGGADRHRACTTSVDVVRRSPWSQLVSRGAEDCLQPRRCAMSTSVRLPDSLRPHQRRARVREAPQCGSVRYRIPLTREGTFACTIRTGPRSIDDGRYLLLETKGSFATGGAPQDGQPSFGASTRAHSRGRSGGTCASISASSRGGTGASLRPVRARPPFSWSLSSPFPARRSSGDV